MDELDQVGVVCKHERIDQNSSLSACGYFLECPLQYVRVERSGVRINSSVGQSHRTWFAVSNHDDLTHIFLLAQEQAARHLEALRRIRVEGANLGFGKLGERDFLCPIPERDYT